MGLDTSKKMGQGCNSETLVMASLAPPLPLIHHSPLEAAAHEEVLLSKRSTTKVVPAGEITSAESLNLLSVDMICPGIDRLRSGFKPASDHLFHVLAVDDSRFDRRVVEKLLKISSCKVTTVSNALKALVVLGLSDNCSSPTKDVDIDLIITDYCMPEMTGYDLLKKVKTSALRGIPVVIMSSENDPDRIRSCLSEGAEEFIIKPVQLSDVKRLKSHMIHPVATSSSLSQVSSSLETGESSGSTGSGKRKSDTPEVTSSERRPMRLKQVRLVNC